MSGRLTEPYYYAQVVGTSVDPNRSGGVQARICGITDEWADENQPWVYPMLGYGMQKVPTRGEWLLIRFSHGDINEGLYCGVSQTQKFLPDEYVLGYPDVAVMNLGEDGYLYTHNRVSHTSFIRNPGNNSEITWNETGEVMVTSGNASEEAERPTLPVLTEGTIDIFTCMPVGSPNTAARAGSEYLSVAHISRRTIDAIRGSVTTDIPAAPAQEPEIDGMDMRDIDGVSNKYSIPFKESPAVKRRTGKIPKRIVIGCTGSTRFAEALSTYTKDDAKLCVHYLVGLGDGDPDVLITAEDYEKAQNLGFIELAELTDDTTYGSHISVAMGDKLNVDSVTVEFYGDGELNDYQKSKLADIASHTKKMFMLETIPVVVNAEQAQYLDKLKQYEGDM